MSLSVGPRVLSGEPLVFLNLYCYKIRRLFRSEFQKRARARFLFIMVSSIKKSDLEEKVISLSSETLEPNGLRVVDADVRLGPTSLVRIFVEKVSETHAPTSLEDCRKANALLGPVIEKEDLTEGSYDLEVSSPGLDSRLRLLNDFNKVVGEEVKIELHASIPGVGANLRGVLKDVNPEGQIKVFSSGKEVGLILTEIKKANRIWNFEKSR